jgi:hypothetical protein
MRSILLASINLMDYGFTRADVIGDVLDSTVAAYAGRHIHGLDFQTNAVIFPDRQNLSGSYTRGGGS